MSIVRRSGKCGTLVYIKALLIICTLSATGCSVFKTTDVFRDPNMDFGSIHTVAVMPFVNLSRDIAPAERVRDVFVTALLATGGVYVIPTGELNRGITRMGIAVPSAPSTEEAVKLGSFIKADALLTGTLKEYGEVRSGSATANVISLSMQMIETQTGRIVWSASTTQGGIGITDRLFGGGGEAMNPITEKAVDDLINKLLP